MNLSQSADEIWQKYIDALKRLERIIEGEATSLNEEDWHNLTSIMGKIENSQLHIKSKWKRLTATKPECLTKNSEEQHSEKYKDEAKLILKKLLRMNEAIEQLLIEEMEKLKTSMSNLKIKRRSHKEYINQKQVEEFDPLDISR